MKKRINKQLELIDRMNDSINYLARRTYLKGMGYETDDLVQEGMLKVVSIFNDKYKELSLDDMAALCFSSVSNVFKGLIRKKFTNARDGITIDLTEAMAISDVNAMNEVYMNYAIEHMKELFSDDEELIFNSLLNPPFTLVELATKMAEEVRIKEVKITNRVLSAYLNINSNKINRLVNSIKFKITDTNIIPSIQV